jgi:hypothetical protein
MQCRKINITRYNSYLESKVLELRKTERKMEDARASGGRGNEELLVGQGVQSFTFAR